MSRELDANVAYGFVIDANIPYDSLSQGFIDVMELSDNPYYNSPDRDFDLSRAISCLLQKAYPMMDVAFPGTGNDNQIVVHVQSSFTCATNEAVSLKDKKVSDEDKERIQFLASLFSKTAGWVLFPTYI